MPGGWNKPQQEKRLAIVAAELKKFPDIGARTLGRKLHEKHPLLFPKLENARAVVRQQLGNMGTKNRKHFKKAGKERREPRKPGQMPPLPESFEKAWVPFILDAKRVLVLPDIHLPYHHKQALTAALAYGVKYKPDAILLNGDVFDFFQISRFQHDDPDAPSVPEELAAGKQFFRRLRYQFPKAEIVFRYGNHDRRWDKYVLGNAPGLLGIPSVLNCWHADAGILEAGVKVVTQQRPVMLGKLPVFHGDELPKGGGVTPARGAFLRAVASLLHSHLHRASQHTERTLDDRIITCWTTGALCGLHPDYARVNKWDHGFATVDIASDGTYECRLKQIIDGRVH